MKHIFNCIIMLLLLGNGYLFAAETSVSAQCNQAITQASINKALLEKVCLQAAKKMESSEHYGGASWYYLLAGKIDYLLSDITTHQNPKTSTYLYSNIGHAYLLTGDYQNAKKNYQQFLKVAEIPLANKEMQDDYKTLQRLYPDKKAALAQGLKQWNEIYSPYQTIDTLSQQYKEARRKRDFKKELDLLEKIKQFLEKKDEKDSESYHIVHNYRQIANFHYAMSDYPKTLEYQLKILSIKEKLLGKQHVDMFAIYNNIGLTYGYLHNSTKALEYHLKSLAIKEKNLGKQHSSTLQSYLYISSSYDALGDRAKSLEYYQKSRSKIFAAAKKEKLLNKATKLNRTAITYYQQGNYPQALKDFQASLTIKEKFLSKEHAEIATSYNNIGGTYGAMDDHSNALEYQLKGLAIKEKTVGKQHPSTARSYKNIGLTYSDMGKHVKALEYQLKALAIEEKIVDKQHPSTATSYNNLGGTYGAMGDQAKALEYHLKALTIRKKLLGKQHPDTAISYNNIGLTYGLMGDHTKALKYKLKAIAILEKGKQYPAIAASYDNIGKTYHAIGEKTKALEYERKALAIKEKLLD